MDTDAEPSLASSGRKKERRKEGKKERKRKGGKRWKNPLYWIEQGSLALRKYLE